MGESQYLPHGVTAQTKQKNPPSIHCWEQQLPSTEPLGCATHCSGMSSVNSRPCEAHSGFSSWQKPIEIWVIRPSSQKFIQTQVCLTRVQLLLINSYCYSPRCCILLLLKEIPLISPLKDSWGFYPMGPLTVQKQIWHQITGWDHYTNVLFFVLSDQSSCFCMPSRFGAG